MAVKRINKAQFKNRQNHAATRADEPIWRELMILAQDPVYKGNRKPIFSKAKVTSEPLMPGPCGARINVVDYDATTDRFYSPMDGEYDGMEGPQDPFIHWTPSQRLLDFRFHQQNVYAICMKVLGRFESALGRRANFAFDGHQLHVVPHAFADANAYYSRESRALFFGYFRNEKKKTIYTCLSHDIIAHETAHALLDGLRPHFVLPSSPDQTAFHEGFADVVALLSILSDKAVVELILEKQTTWEAKTKLVSKKELTADSLKNTSLFALAESMGSTLPNGSIEALRNSVRRKPNATWKDDPDFVEPHDRGEILVAAIMEAFVNVWVKRIAPLGTITRDKVDGERVVEEGATAASHLLTICIRALDYSLTNDMTYSDYLSAVLTADRETLPDDSKYQYRKTIATAFRSWGIWPASRQDTDGCWEAFEGQLSYATIRNESFQRHRDEAFRFLWRNTKALKLAQDAYTEVTGVRSIARVAADGIVVKETVVDYLQIKALYTDELTHMGLKAPERIPRFREIKLYGGGALVFDEFGQLKFSIGNSVSNVARQQARLNYLAATGFFDYKSDEEFTNGFFSRLHVKRAGGR